MYHVSGLKKKLAALSLKSKHRTLAKWIKSICNHMYWVVDTTEHQINSGKVNGYLLSTILLTSTHLTTQNFQAVSMACLTTWLMIMGDKFNEFGSIKVVKYYLSYSVISNFENCSATIEIF